MAEIEKSKAVAEKKPKKDKPSVFARMGKFFKEYKAELGKVTWASKEDTKRNFIVVAITVVIAGAVIGVLDFAFSESILALGKLI